jgi:hypothetical protein
MSEGAGKVGGVTELAVALLAATVGSTTTLAVFFLSTRHERGQERERRAQLDEDRQREARTESVVRVVNATAMQPKDLVFAPLYGHHQALELLQACMAFALVNGGQHPPVAAWVMQQHGRIHAARRRLWWVAWLPLVRGRRSSAWGAELGLLAEALWAWEAGGREDSWFEEHLEISTARGDERAVTAGADGRES